jgi:N-acetylglucosaminyldiphosphoundecaprenol N-acetyl-beta-D-mannosaminyltransferase
MRVDATSYPDAARRVIDWARGRESRYVCCASVNNVMEAFDSAEFRGIMNEADLVTPDGMPLVWGLRLLGARPATRVYGPDLTALVLEEAAHDNLPVGFYGASAPTLHRLAANLRKRFPSLRIDYAFSPPFRALAADEKTLRLMGDAARQTARKLTPEYSAKAMMRAVATAVEIRHTSAVTTPRQYQGLGD